MINIIIICLSFILLSTNCFSINIAFDKQYDIFKGNLNISNTIIKDYTDGNYLVVFSDQQINLAPKVHLMIIDSDGNLIKKKFTQYEGFVQDVAINKSGEIKILALSADKQAPYLYSFFQTIFVDNNLENLEYYSTDTLMRNNNFPKFIDFNNIIESTYNAEEEFPYIYLYTDKCVKYKQIKVGYFPLIPTTNEYVGRSNIIINDSGYILTYDIGAKNQSSKISKTIIILDKDFKPSLRGDFGKSNETNQYKVYDIVSNHPKLFALRYLHYSLFIKKENHFECFDKNLNLIFSTDTVPIVFEEAFLLRDGGIILSYFDNITNDYFIKRYNNLGKLDNELLFYKPLIDTTFLGTITFNQSESGTIFLSAQSVYKGNDWDKNENPFGYRKFRIMKIDATLDITDADIRKNLTLSPNPASNYITIQFNNKGLQPFTEVDNVQIFDMLGIEIKDHTQPLFINGEGVRINISQLTSGVYFVKIGDR
ncbi:MAG TPA: T9SS type A sorting domain-containing protein, partial [Candidatus Kapabacteria bacterium]|nr:T9SS type A sorting domain-containing protein [Candidatus Kapabacteria bacterium]